MFYKPISRGKYGELANHYYIINAQTDQLVSHGIQSLAQARFSVGHPSPSEFQIRFSGELTPQYIKLTADGEWFSVDQLEQETPLLEGVQAGDLFYTLRQCGEIHAGQKVRFCGFQLKSEVTVMILDEYGNIASVPLSEWDSCISEGKSYDK